MAILNRYKDILNNFNDSSDVESPDLPRSIDKGSYNTLKSKSSLTEIFERDC